MTKKERQRQSERLGMWQKRLAQCRGAYGAQLEKMRQRNDIYNGAGTAYGGTAYGGAYGDDARSAEDGGSHVYNAAYELIESQVDSNIPAPRVTAQSEASAPLAARAEEMLRAKLDELPFEEFNDMDERNCYNQGGDFALVEWDDGVCRHAGRGALKVSVLHPSQVIPQAGVCELEEMDYVFVVRRATRAALKQRYGLWHNGAGGRETAADGGDGSGGDGAARGTGGEMYGGPAYGDDAGQEGELATVVTAYYKNGEGGIGRYVFCGDVVLEDLFDYEARRVRRCVSCGAAHGAFHDGGEGHGAGGEGHGALREGPGGGEVCGHCGGRRFEEREEEYEEIPPGAVRSEGSHVQTGAPYVGGEFPEDGRQGGGPFVPPRGGPVRAACYRPRCYPLVLRKNVSKHGSFLGLSDIDVIRPQQDAIKKLGGNVMEKLLKGGSYVTLPAGVRVETTARQLKVLRVENPAQKALVDVLNVQPNISFDMAALSDQYEKAKSALGITASFQGKPDKSAQSGVAKRFSAAQAAGRLESKRRMKGAFYQRLFEVMFRFMLAYSDGQTQYPCPDEAGGVVWRAFNRYDFLRCDAAGQWYWEDEFLFGVDATGGLAQNREAMWEEAERRYLAGAMGDVGSDETRLLYWTLMEQLQFPLAKAVKRSVRERLEERGAAGPAPGAALAGDAGEGPGALAGMAAGGAREGALPGGGAKAIFRPREGAGKGSPAPAAGGVSGGVPGLLAGPAGAGAGGEPGADRAKAVLAKGGAGAAAGGENGAGAVSAEAAGARETLRALRALGKGGAGKKAARAKEIGKILRGLPAGMLAEVLEKFMGGLNDAV